MQNLEKINSDFRANYKDDPDFSIDFFSQHLVFLNSITTFKNEEELKFYIEIIWQYINSIYRKDRFRDTILHVDKALALIDSELDRLNSVTLKDNWYYGIHFLKGMAYYKIKNYKESSNIFKQLSQTDRRNEGYKNWLTHSIYGERLWLLRLTNIIFGLMVATAILLKEFIENSSFRLWILGIGLLGLSINMGIKYYVERNFRKTNSH